MILFTTKMCLPIESLIFFTFIDFAVETQLLKILLNVQKKRKIVVRKHLTRQYRTILS